MPSDNAAVVAAATVGWSNIECDHFALKNLLWKCHFSRLIEFEFNNVWKFNKFKLTCIKEYGVVS